MNKKEVTKKIGRENWDKFLDFMEGQTSLLIDGKPDFFEIDVDNFINKLKGKPTFWD